jgi:hypothetical protein
VDLDCARCQFLAVRSAGPGSTPIAEAGPAHCSIRELPIDDPEGTFCANHSSLTPKPDRIAVGPVLRRSPESPEGNSILHETQDNRSVRDHLLDIVERIQVRSLADLTLREATAIWQLTEFREPRAHFYIDRIEGDVSGPGIRLEPMEVTLGKHLFKKVVGEGIHAGEDDTPLLERITLRGRILLLSSLVAGAAAFYTLFVLLHENPGPGTRIPNWILAIVSILAGGAFLACGVFLFRRMGVRFLVHEEQG